MRPDHQKTESSDSEDWADWPEAASEIDDEEFARAIAEGRQVETAA